MSSKDPKKQIFIKKLSIPSASTKSRNNVRENHFTENLLKSSFYKFYIHRLNVVRFVVKSKQYTKCKKQKCSECTNHILSAIDCPLSL